MVYATGATTPKPSGRRRGPSPEIKGDYYGVPRGRWAHSATAASSTPLRERLRGSFAPRTGAAGTGTHIRRRHFTGGTSKCGLSHRFYAAHGRRQAAALGASRLEATDAATVMDRAACHSGAAGAAPGRSPPANFGQTGFPGSAHPRERDHGSGAPCGRTPPRQSRDRASQ